MSTQYVDPLVSTAKFNREIDEYKTLDGEYRKRGWFLVHAQYPTALVLLATPTLKPPALIAGVEFDYSNYDSAPPSVRLVDPFTREPYKAKDLPTQLNRALPQQTMAVPGMPAAQRLVLQQALPLMQAHRADDIPFLCLAGVREYHAHPAHSGDVWELHRTSGAGRLVRLLEVIHKYGVLPIVGYSVQLVPQVGLEFGPPPS